MKVQVIMDIEFPEFTHSESDMERILNIMNPLMHPHIQSEYANRNIHITSQWHYTDAQPELFVEEANEQS